MTVRLRAIAATRNPSPQRCLAVATLTANAIVVLILSACTGGDDDASAQTTIVLRPTNYVTLPVITTSTTTTQPPAVPDGGDGVAAPEGEGRVYRVRRGDALPLIADRYGITVAELVDYNDWSDGRFHAIFPGDQVRIPPGADEPEPEVEEVSDPDPNSDDGLGTMPPPEDGPICPDGSERDTYEVVAGDYISRVADKNDLTIDELDEANADNPAYDTFAPGQELWLPCSEDDETAAG